MDFSILQFLGGLVLSAAQGAAAAAGAIGAGQLLKIFKQRTIDLKGPEVRRLLEGLGTVTPDAVRKLVHETLKNAKPPVRPEDREDLAAVLISLARGASLLNTQGDPRSTYLGVKELMERLVAQVQPARRAGEKVAPGHEWILRQFLGMGTFGEVWLADHGRAPGLPKRAYKFFTHSDARPWLEREKDALQGVMAKLKTHPQVVQLVDLGVPSRGGDPFLAFEYVAGGSLEDWLSDPARSQRPLRKGEVMRGIVRTVAAAHEQGIYHLDLKPGNILLTTPPDVQPKITDFGLSRVDAAAVEAGAELLQVGTPLYWPPEAQRPFADRQPALFDVFALGVLWYQLLVERVERPAYDFQDELGAAGSDSHTLGLIGRCLAHPERRFRNAVELAEHMDQADLPVWDPVPKGQFDVQHLVREYVGLSSK